jgi:EAL domain-containing protein (putative c-di-GMP-specific phosphodiesterase class I)
MDDFGTGYSSLICLTQLPTNLVKIDGSFIRPLGADLQAASLLEAIIRMTRVVGLKVVAEGVETDEQLRLLQGFECDDAQGYLFSKPAPPEKVPGCWGGGGPRRNSPAKRSGEQKRARAGTEIGWSPIPDVRLRSAAQANN